MSFQQGISGLNAASRNLEVIGSNIANANTVGAKMARAEFADVYSNASSLQARNEAGMGVRVAAITQQFTQGSIRTTSNPMDVAINGGGFFQVTRTDGSDMSYTRNGQFQLDAKGYVVTSGGMRLQGYAIDPATGKPAGVPGPIFLPTQGVTPRVTSSATVQLNLDGRTPASTADTPPFRLTDNASYTGSTSTAVFDQQGNEQTLSMYFRRTGNDNQWEVYTSLNGQPVPAPVAPSTQQLPSGRLTFNPDGTMNAAASGSLMADGTLQPGELNVALPFKSAVLNAATTAAPVSVSFAGSTQFGSVFGVTSTSQDGYAAGQLTGFGIASNGLVEARYSNGKTLGAAQIALADFRNDQGLQPVGNNLWRATPASGQAAVGVPGSGNLGMVQGGALEDSNIDMTQQLVDMITAQRSYQANAQTIKTQDQMLSTLVNLR